MIYINGEPCSGTIEEAKLFGLISESDEVYEVPDELAEAIAALTNTSTAFECMARITEKMMLKIFGLWDAIVDCCPDRRVVHLMRYAKKAKVRRKNLHRAIKILERI